MLVILNTPDSDDHNETRNSEQTITTEHVTLEDMNYQTRDILASISASIVASITESLEQLRGELESLSEKLKD